MKTFLKTRYKPLQMIILVVIVATVIGAAGRITHNDFEISKNLDIYATIIRQLNINYVDEINPGHLSKVAIDAMLKSLDPFTEYLPEADIEDYRMTQGTHAGGAGFTVTLRNGRHLINGVVNNSPAMNAGLLVGDILLSIDGHTLEERSAEEVNLLLSGQSGTTVSIRVQRPYTEEVFTHLLERAHNRAEAIPWSGIPKDHIAYVSLRSFTQNAGREVKEAYLKLTSENDVRGLILDLRGNGGGLLMEAVHISNLFVRQNEVIASTRGRISDRNSIYRTPASPMDMEIPVVVLIDPQSASASEIVAGALQDLDRGVVIGQTSYGKGTVQNVIPLVYNAQLKVTIAKYHIPSGRCIQAAYPKDPGGNIPDSLVTPFKTRNGRTVYDGKGIIPDIKVNQPPLSPVARALMNTYTIFDFATWYRIHHDSIAPPEHFMITNKIWDEFISYLNDNQFKYTTNSEKKLTALANTIEEDGYAEMMQQELSAITAALEMSKRDDINRNRSEIARLLKSELIYRYYFDTGLVKAGLASDQELQEAYRILKDQETYRKMLAGGYRQL